MVLGPRDWATGFHLMLIKRGTQALPNLVCLIQDIIEFYDGWFVSIKPDVCIEIFLLVGRVEMALRALSPGRIVPCTNREICNEPSPFSAALLPFYKAADWGQNGGCQLQAAAHRNSLLHTLKKH